MHLPPAPSNAYQPVINHVAAVQKQIDSPSAAVYVIRGGQVVTEWYTGTERGDESRPLQAESRFNVHSVRKSYIGLAVALAVQEGKIASIDDPILNYLDGYDRDVVADTTIRHLLTHSHGLTEDENGRILRVFPAGTDWMYVNTGIDMLARLVKHTMSQSVAALLQHRVFAPLGFTETGWLTEEVPHLVYDRRAPEPTPRLQLFDSPDGDARNMFVSARELAYWGYFHLQKGCVDGRQVLPSSLFEQTTVRQSPVFEKERFQLNGYLWFVQEASNPCMEIGEHVPRGSYQILGSNGCAVLVIPNLDVVAVRMYSKLGNPPGYNYLQDIRTFGNLVTACTTA